VVHSKVPAPRGQSWGTTHPEAPPSPDKVCKVCPHTFDTGKHPVALAAAHTAQTAMYRRSREFTKCRTLQLPMSFIEEPLLPFLSMATISICRWPFLIGTSAL
jgi:hypothetical protein